ncbi:MAG: hypothetical protein E4H03_04560 [Myxococcales bacterium]|nr:MAG: hypothetical protein E4H03_04560 [Myxococcales bacterium]
MTRMIGWPALLIAVVGALHVASGCDHAERADRDRPRDTVCPDCNVLLISMDTLRADHVGAYGYERPTTPTIDALAARGVVFENAISQSSWTRPAHMSMFTGLYPAEHGFIALVNRGRLADDVPTLASTLGDHGYTTAAFTGGVNVSPAFGFDRGFDLYRTNGRLYRNSMEELGWWLEQNRDEKLFVFFHGYDPHTPYHSDPIAREAMGLTGAPPGKGFRRACEKGKPGPRLRRYVDEYDAAIRRGDRYVEKLLARMDELGLLEHTLIVFTSDHGEEFLEHGRCFHLSSLYREVLHVPLIIAGAGIDEPRRIAELVPASVGIGPTILQLVGIADHQLPGPSLAPAVRGAPLGLGPVQSETSRHGDTGRGDGHVRSLTTADAKLVHFVTKDEAVWFDLAGDPLESTPLTDAAELARLQALLDRWLLEHPRQPVTVGAVAAEKREIDRQLKALGYVD